MMDLVRAEGKRPVLVRDGEPVRATVYEDEETANAVAEAIADEGTDDAVVLGFAGVFVVGVGDQETGRVREYVFTH